MGKPTGKKKVQVGIKSSDATAKHNKAALERSNSIALDEEDTAVFINLSQELKEEGNKLFQRHDHQGAMLKYEKAVKLLSLDHIDVPYLRTNMATCYMKLGIGEYPRAVNQCNLALQVAPKYIKALLKRAKCYEALNRLDLALKDVDYVLSMEPNNLTALEISESLKKAIKEKGVQVEVKETVLTPDHTNYASVSRKKTKKRKSNKIDRKKVEVPKAKKVNEVEDKVVIEEKRSIEEVKLVLKSVKLVYGEDIRWAQLPVNCSVRLVRDVVIERFAGLKGVLIKYKDQEGDLVTITTTDELRIAEGLADPRGFLRLYVAEVSPDKEPLYEGMETQKDVQESINEKPAMVITGDVNVDKGSSCLEDWIVEFARIFKNQAGFECDSNLKFHEVGMKLYSEAIEDTATSEDSQEIFDIAAAKFQEMAALALFNQGNVHMSKARKKVLHQEESSAESILTQVKDAYDWSQKEYEKAGMSYEEALKIKPNFYEGLLALGQQLFEQAKLSWYNVIGCKAEIEIGESTKVLDLYNKAEDSMEKGMQMWEEIEEQRLNGVFKLEKDKDVSADEGAINTANMRSQIYLLWGRILYERSAVEYKLSLRTWEECLEVAVEKFELAGALPNDIAVMIKNHCSNKTALEGFKVDEIVEAWNEMYDTDRWRTGAASLRLEPLFRRRSPKHHSVLEHFE